VRTFECRLDIDERLGREEQLDLRAPLEPIGAQAVPQPAISNSSRSNGRPRLSTR
jgi:hypothetical protein